MKPLLLAPGEIILPGEELLHVRYRLNAFRDHWREMFFRRGASLADIADGMMLEHPDLRAYLVVRINGRRVPREWWPYVKPHAHGSDGGAVRIDFEIEPQGSGRRILFALAAVALIAASFYLGGLPAAAGFGLKALGLKALAALSATAASLALQGVFLAPPPEGPAQSMKQLGFAGFSNDFEPGGFLSRVLGTMKVAPKTVVPPFNTWVDDDEFVTWVGGLAGRHQISTVRNGEALIEDADDAEIETREGTAADDPISFTPDTRIQANVGITLSKWLTDAEISQTNNVELRGTEEEAEPKWHRVETKRDCDQFNFFFAFGPLIFQPQTTDEQTSGVGVRVRMRRSGEATWINWPDLVFTDRSRRPTRGIVEVHWVDAIPAQAGNDWGDTAGTFPYTPPEGRGWLMLVTVPDGSSALATPTGAAGFEQWYWEAKKVILYLDKAIYPKGKYEFEVKRGWGFIWEDVGTMPGFPNPDLFSPKDIGGGDLRITYNPDLISDEIVIPFVQSVFDEYPIVDDGVYDALLGVRLKNKQIETITCIATGQIEGAGGDLWQPPDLWAVADLWDVGAAIGPSNPAQLYYAALTGPHTDEPVPASRINVERLIEWQEFCEANNLHCNAVVEGKLLPDTLRMIARCGMARPIFAPLHSVAIDTASGAGLTGMITKRNARFGAATKVLALRPHALKASFQDADRGYEIREIVEYADGYNEDGSGGLIEASRFEAQQYEGYTSEALLRERMAHDLKWLRWRDRVVPATMDVEHFELEPGQVVGLEIDTLGARHASARIVSIETSGGNVEAFILDEKVTVAAGAGVAFRQADGTVRTEAIEPSGVNPKRIAFTTPFAMPTSGGDNLIVAGAVVSIGDIGDEMRRMRVVAIRPTGNHEAEVELVDDADEGMFVAQPQPGDALVKLGDSYVMFGTKFTMAEAA